MCYAGELATWSMSHVENGDMLSANILLKFSAGKVSVLLLLWLSLLLMVYYRHGLDIIPVKKRKSILFLLQVPGKNAFHLCSMLTLCLIMNYMMTRKCNGITAFKDLGISLLQIPWYVCFIFILQLD